MNFLNAAQLILPLLPIITDAVKQVEALNATPGNGSHKLQLVMVVVKSIYEASNPPEPFSSIEGKVSDVVSALVTFYNNIGAFVRAVKVA